MEWNFPVFANLPTNNPPPAQPPPAAGPTFNFPVFQGPPPVPWIEAFKNPLPNALDEQNRIKEQNRNFMTTDDETIYEQAIHRQEENIFEGNHNFTVEDQFVASLIGAPLEGVNEEVDNLGLNFQGGRSTSNIRSATENLPHLTADSLASVAQYASNVRDNGYLPRIRVRDIPENVQEGDDINNFNYFPKPAVNNISLHAARSAVEYMVSESNRAKIIGNMSPNFRTIPMRINLKGIYLGQLCKSLSDHNVNLDGLYLYGTVRQYTMRVIPTNNGRKEIRLDSDNVVLMSFPLSKVEYSEEVAAVSNTTLLDDLQGHNNNTFAVRYLQKEFSDINANLESGENSEPAHNYQCLSDCYIVKHHHPINWINQKVVSLRTGSLNSIIVQEYHRELFWREGDKEEGQFIGEIIIPNGKDNCIRRCVYFGLISKLSEEITFEEFKNTNHEEDLEDYQLLIYDLARQRFEEIFNNYDAFREKKIQSRSNYKAYKKRTLYGYSNKEVKILIEFLFLNYNIRLHLLYLGKPSGNNINFQDISKSVLNLKPSKEKIKKMNLSDFNNIHHIWAIQMTDRGNIHCVDSSYSETRETYSRGCSLSISRSGVKRKRDDPEEIFENNINNTEDTEEIADDILMQKSLRLYNNMNKSSGLLHAVFLSSPHCKMSIRSGNMLNDRNIEFSHFRCNILNSGVEFTFRFVKSFELITQKIMVDLYNSTIYDPYLTSEEIRNLVNYQIERYNNRSVRTLIFKSCVEEFKHFQNLPPKASSITKLNGAIKSGNNYGAFVWDSETVCCNGDAMERSMIYPPLLEIYNKNCPGDNNSLTAEEAECITNVPYEMPYSAQVAPINLDDVGIYKERKISLSLPVRNDLSILKKEAFTRSEPVFGQNAVSEEYPNIKYHDIILDEVKVFDGEGIHLGKCIFEMLEYVATFSFRMKWKFAYLYAHNSARFDTQILMVNLPYPITRILITHGGTTSVNYRVPVPHQDNEFITVTFRDSRSWLSESLHSLCQGFKVPKHWAKLDYPIRMVTKYNWNLERVKQSVLPYSKADVLSLSWVLHFLNIELGADSLKSANPLSLKPPLLQKVTLMSDVKDSLRNFFFSKSLTHEEYISKSPKAIDVPKLRNLVCMYGGVVLPIARHFICPQTKNILSIYMSNFLSETEKKKMLSKEHAVAFAEKKLVISLDKTSLYPSVWKDCPLATGKLIALSNDELQNCIDDVLCIDCFQLAYFCPKHNCSDGDLTKPTRPFCMIVIKNLKCTRKNRVLSICPRKSTIPQRCATIYSFEDTEELNKRIFEMVYKREYGSQKSDKEYEDEDNDKEAYLKNHFVTDNLVYSNIDLAIMKSEGWIFEIVGGFGFETSFFLKEYVESLFELRLQAKEEKNDVKSQFYKRRLNGSYGCTIQKDITTNFIITELPASIRFNSPKDPAISQYLTYNKLLDASEYIKECKTLPNGMTLIKKEKFNHIDEYYSAQAPNQVGASTLAYAKLSMNLFMRRVHPFYTDTDSCDMTEEDHQLLKSINPRLVDHSSSGQLGTLKNDFLGDEPDEIQKKRAFLCFYVAAKCKLRFCIDAHGEISITLTFKGFSPLNTDPENGRKLHPDSMNFTIAKAIIDIYFFGKPDNARVAHWFNNLTYGVSVTEFTQIGSSTSYLSKHKGVGYLSSDKSTQYFIPFGSNLNAQFEFKKNNEGEYYIDNNQQRIQEFEKDFGFGYNDLILFLQKYYSNYQQYYQGDDDYEEIVNMFLGEK